MSPAQALAYSAAEVLKHGGEAGREPVDAWDPLSDPLASGAPLKADYLVDPAGAAPAFRTVQSAVDAALADARSSHRKARVHIEVRPGTYRELLYVPKSAAPITLFGSSPDARHSRIVATLDATMTGRRYGEAFASQFAAAEPALAAMFAEVKARDAIGTAGSSVAWIQGHGFQAKNLTFENGHDRGEGAGAGTLPEKPSPAVALMVDGADKVQFENVRFIGLQDTLFLRSAGPGRAARSFFNRSHVEGDVDFIFGDATAYFQASEIRSLGRWPHSYAIAPSTHYLDPYGFVFNACRFTHDGSPNARAGRFHLARQWFRGQRCTPYGAVDATPGYACRLGVKDAYDAPAGTISRSALEAVGKVVVLNSRIGSHIDRMKPWSAWNVPGSRQYRPVQYDSDAFWSHLEAAGIHPARDLGYRGRKIPAEPFLAEYRNTED